MIFYYKKVVNKKERERRGVVDSLYQVMVFHVKVKDDTICKYIGKVGHKTEGCKMVKGAEIGKKRQWNKQAEQVDSSMSE